MQEKILELKNLLQNPQKIVITVHRGPDGDALGSALALQNLLVQLNHSVTVISPNDYANFLHWLPGNDNVVIYSEEEEKVNSITKEADLIFLMDLNSISRLDNYSESVKRSSAKIVMIDHHQDPDKHKVDLIFSDIYSSSTSQLLYEIIEELGFQELINKDIAECIYTGIMTDTGSFKYPSTTDKTHHIIAELISKGADNSKIHDLIYDNYSEDRIKLLGYCINDKLLLYPQFKSAIISLTEDELNRFNFKKGDTEGVVNYALSVQGIIFAVFIAEKEEKVKMSFRSKGNFKVNTIAKKYFNGGGHANAAGGISDYSVDETIKKLEKIFKEYKNKLLNNK